VGHRARIWASGVTVQRQQTNPNNGHRLGRQGMCNAFICSMAMANGASNLSSGQVCTSAKNIYKKLEVIPSWVVSMQPPPNAIRTPPNALSICSLFIPGASFIYFLFTLNRFWQARPEQLQSPSRGLFGRIFLLRQRYHC
jgi:hypothetical protein